MNRDERDLVPCPGAPHKWIERRELGGVPSKLWDYCQCGAPQGYGIDHPLCDFTASEPGEKWCEECGRYRNCSCETERRTGVKTYLGDAVYAEFDAYQGIVLTTEDGIRVTNRIVLEAEVWLALKQWVDRGIAAAKKSLTAEGKLP